MEPGVNILVVEDEKKWQGTYERAVNFQGSGRRVKVAADFEAAERLIDATKFAVAFVDVGLDVTDDRNVDGLRVMEKIRAVGDKETSIVVITGRSGQDLLDIVRDAILKYRAFYTVGKRSVEPAQIRDLLADGLKAYEEATVVSRTAVRDALRGSTATMSWDDQVMRAIGFKGDVSKLYGFLNELLAGHLPIVTRDDGQPVMIDPAAGLVHGNYWSRGIASALVVCFGSAAQFDKALETARADGMLLGMYRVGEPAAVVEGQGIKGAVFPLEGGRREDFAGQRANPE